MKFLVAAAALLSLAQGVFALTINTPTNVVVCQPILLTWADGAPPYYLALIPSYNIALKDSTGVQAYSDTVSPSSQSDMSCLNSTSSDVSNGPAATTAENTGTTAAAGATTTGAAAATTAANASSAASKSTSAPATKTAGAKTTSATHSNAASDSNAGVYGMAGIMALVGLAVL
ncbi:hypothetical protein C0991_012373 [Blastosporella zonata]|nr:hypothetical protein C0991_012373 [Blastosporella zonata]